MNRRNASLGVRVRLNPLKTKTQKKQTKDASRIARVI